MKKLLTVCFLFASTILLSGCGNLSPRQSPKIENNGGKIDEIKNNQNGILAEIGTLKNQAEIQNSQLEKIQQGMFNLQQNNDNHGIQIFSGQGGLALGAIVIITMGVLILHFRRQAKLNEKTANILAERISLTDDPNLEDEVFHAAMYSEVEDRVLSLMKKHKNRIKH